MLTKVKKFMEGYSNRNEDTVYLMLSNASSLAVSNAYVAALAYYRGKTNRKLFTMKPDKTEMKFFAAYLLADTIREFTVWGATKYIRGDRGFVFIGSEPFQVEELDTDDLPIYPWENDLVTAREAFVDGDVDKTIEYLRKGLDGMNVTVLEEDFDIYDREELTEKIDAVSQRLETLESSLN